jgi:hypothetical protein
MSRPTIIGFVTGAALPVSYGVYVFFHEMAYRSSLGPGEGACGMGMCLAYSLILIVGPVCGTVVAIAVAAGSTIGRALTKTRDPTSTQI